MVLDCNLDNHLQVLPVVAEHVVQELQSCLRRHSAHVLSQELGRHLVGVHHHSLQVSDVRIVLKSVLHKSRLLAETSDVCAVVVGEHVHLQDRLCNLWCLLQVHRQQLSLQLPLLWLVVLECIEQDGGGLLQAVALHEHLDDCIDVDERALLAGEQVLGKVCSSFWARCNHVSQQCGVVCLESNLLHIRDDLVVLAKLNKAVDGLLVRVCPEIDGQCKLHLHGEHNVTELLSALKLVLLEPLLHELSATLLHHRAHELHGLNCVQLAILEQGGEVQQDGWLPIGLHSLELVDSFRRSQHATLALSDNLRCSLVITRSEHLRELALEQLVSPWQAKASCQSECDLHSVWQALELIHDVAHENWLVHLDACGHALLVHIDETSARCASNCDENHVLRHFGADQHRCRSHVKDQEKASLGDHVNHSVLLAEVKGHCKVRRSFRWHLHLALHLEGCWQALASWLCDIHNVQPGLHGSHLAL
mmetsp:Transcript_30328/g.70761  ORF Transcript_30328/g.70761 Transcript_30328/m.70761 type:complete len:477 (+) Transcript_30328:3188-4618(+)